MSGVNQSCFLVKKLSDSLKQKCKSVLYQFSSVQFKPSYKRSRSFTFRLCQSGTDR